MSRRVLVCWVGETDLKCAEDKELGLGPIAQALTKRDFDAAVLVSNWNSVRVDSYLRWLRPQTKSQVSVRTVSLKNPMDFAGVYTLSVETVEAVLDEVKGTPSKSDVQLTFHISPGTSAMAAILIILSKTRYRAELIGTTRLGEIYTPSIPFHLSAEFMGDLLSAPDTQLEQQSQARAPEAAEFKEIVGRSKAIRDVIARAQKVAPRSVPVLIEGESGTGKELFARAIHSASLRQGKPFIAINCGAIPKDLVEGELFGHRKGTFTGADASRLGHFRQAHGGTLFLDELGELPLEAQVKLLRVLQEKAVTPVGESHAVPVDVRIIAATNRKLAEQVKEGLFREDLFYRLAVAVLRLPPLREREGDLTPVVDALLDRINQDSSKEPGYRHKKLSPGARNVIHSHSWPGNVRELQNTLMRAAIWSEGDSINKGEMEAALFDSGVKAESILNRPLSSGFKLKDPLGEVVQHYLGRALEEAQGNKSKAAALIGFASYQTMTNWAHKYGVKM